jgi:hypothetical protein
MSAMSLLFLPLLDVIGVIADVDAPRARVVLPSELDAAGYTNALEIPLLLSSDVVTADVELDQRPLVQRRDISVIIGIT